MAMSGDLVAMWEVSLPDGIHIIEFEHGTTTGKRIIRVDGKEIKREDWMFKLVGSEEFEIGKQANKAKCKIIIEAVSGFMYEYTLQVNGKSLKKFKENQSRIMKTWCLPIDGKMTRIVLEKDTLEIWANGKIMETVSEFTDDGTETHFELGSKKCYITAFSSGKRREGIVHCLVVDGVEIPPSSE